MEHPVPPLSEAFERTRLERADQTGAHSCFALAERSSEEAGSAQLLVVQSASNRRSAKDTSFLKEFGCTAATGPVGEHALFSRSTSGVMVA
jgi:hypothetical protein